MGDEATAPVFDYLLRAILIALAIVDAVGAMTSIGMMIYGPENLPLLHAATY
jgi:hypothetical protein